MTQKSVVEGLIINNEERRESNYRSQRVSKKRHRRRRPQREGEIGIDSYSGPC